MTVKGRKRSAIDVQVTHCLPHVCAGQGKALPRFLNRVSQVRILPRARSNMGLFSLAGMTTASSLGGIRYSSAPQSGPRPWVPRSSSHGRYQFVKRVALDFLTR